MRAPLLFGLLVSLSSLLAFGSGCAGEAGEGDSTVDATPSAADEGVAESEAALGSAPTVRVMTYNIKYGAMSGLDLGKIADVVKESNPDILALQEVDELTKRSGNQQETDELSKLTNLRYRYFGTNFPLDGGRYGLAILSKYPLFNTRVIRLDTRTTRGGGYEPRIAIAAEVTVAGRSMTFVSMHASIHEEERGGNARAVLKALGARARDTLIAGDMNESPDHVINDTFEGARFDDAFRDRHRFLLGKTSPAVFPIKRLDMIYKGESFGSTTRAWVPSTQASDHRPLAATIQLR